MALILTEPFNDFTTNGWTNLSGATIVAGRTGTAAQMVAGSNVLLWSVPGGSQTDSQTVGFAYKASDLTADRQCFSFRSLGATVEQTFFVTTGGEIRVGNNAGGSYTSVGAGIAANTWAYIEVSVKLHDTAGTITVRVNGVQVLSVTGIDTHGSSNTTLAFDQLRLETGGGSYTPLYDDLYVRNDLTFQGDPTNTTQARNARLSVRTAFVGALGVNDVDRNYRQSLRVAFQTSTLLAGTQVRMSRLQTRVLGRNTAVGPARLSRLQVRALVSLTTTVSTTDARVAQIDARALVQAAGVSARTAQISARMAVRNPSPEARIAQVSIRTVTKILPPETDNYRTTVRVASHLAVPPIEAFRQSLRVVSRASTQPTRDLLNYRQSLRVLTGKTILPNQSLVTFTAVATAITDPDAPAVWRAFTIRRTIGGDILRAERGWHGALRYGIISVPFDIVAGTTLTAKPIGYDETEIKISVPPTFTWQEAVLVRGGFGYPTTPLDGVPIWYSEQASTDKQFNQLVHDMPLTGGYWYYYTLFLCVGDPGTCQWLAAAHAYALVPRQYHTADKLFSLIPAFYQRTDDQQAADGRHGPLRKLTDILGYENDYERTLLDGVLHVYNADFAPLKFTTLLGNNLGLPTEQALGGARYRSLVGRLFALEGMRGTPIGLQRFIYAASNYRCTVTTGPNQLLTPDDSEFVAGVGHWQRFTNPIVASFENHFSGLVPVVPTDKWAFMAVHTYAGTDIPLSPDSGQGIMEVAEVTVTATAGTPGTIVGGPFANLLALQTADPPCVPFPSSPWFVGQYIVLGDTSHASWNGTAWVAGPGTAPRPAATQYVAGAPGTVLPFGALPPADFGSIPFINTDGVSPPRPFPEIGWKLGDYIVLGDGSHAHIQQNSPVATPSILWAVSNGTLPTTPPDSCTVISGKVGVWYAAGVPVAAPANLAALKAISSAPVATSMPMDPVNGYMRTYDNTKVALVGFRREASSSASTTLAAGRWQNMPRLTAQNDTAWAEYTRPLGPDQTSVFNMYGPNTSGMSVYVPISMPAGWSRIPFTQSTQAGVWSDGGTHVTFTPSSAITMQVDLSVVSYPPSGNSGTSAFPAFPDGTKIAIRVAGTDWAVCEIGGSAPLHLASGSVALYLLGDIHFLAGQTVEAWFFNPTGAALNMGAVNSSVNTYPFLHGVPYQAVPGYGTPGDTTGGGWVCPVTDKYYIHGHTEAAGGTWFIFVNGKPVVVAQAGADGKMDITANVSMTAGDVVSWGGFFGYAPASHYMTRNAGITPVFEVYRWAAV